MIPEELRYSEDHEWVRIESDGSAVVGITDYAAEQLGDVVFLDLPEADTQVTQSEKMGEVESVKAVSDVVSPVSGRVIERNQAVIDGPELVNDSPYEAGWMIKVEVKDASEMDTLMSARQYESYLQAKES